MFHRKKDSKQVREPGLDKDMKKIRDRVARLGVPEKQFKEEKEEHKTHKRDFPAPRKSENNKRSLEGISQSMMQIPEPPRSKEIKVPNIEKGPLFINKNKFFEAEEIVQEMKGLSNELGEELSTIKETLRQDVGTSSQLEQVLNNVENTVSSLKKIVSP